MKKNIHLPIHSIIINCLYCNKQYQISSISSQNISTSTCSGCNPFYTGTLVSQINVGAVEKYRQREQKAKDKGSN
ncbi:MAG: 50S ribosomal protein L31 [Mycoplasmataceae bacterium]|nr:MAG: 50S ribosomal protein L31 [Mycoplasmataceae bacterium]